ARPLEQVGDMTGDREPKVRRVRVLRPDLEREEIRRLAEAHGTIRIGAHLDGLTRPGEGDPSLESAAQPLTPALSLMGRGRPHLSSATVDPLSGGAHRPLLPGG